MKDKTIRDINETDWLKLRVICLTEEKTISAKINELVAAEVARHEQKG